MRFVLRGKGCTVLQKASCHKVLVIPVISVTLRPGGVGKWYQVNIFIIKFAIDLPPNEHLVITCSLTMDLVLISQVLETSWPRLSSIESLVPVPLLIPCFDTNFMLQKRHFNSQHSLPSFSPKVLIQPSLLLAGTFLYLPIHFALPFSAAIFFFFFNQTDSSVCVCVCVCVCVF